MIQLTINLFSFSDLYEKDSNELYQKITDEKDPFLIKQLSKDTRNNLLINYSVTLIFSLHGLTTIYELEKKTGYSKRCLDLLFKNQLGISPKTLATIYRFQYFYKHFTPDEILTMTYTTISHI
jgi:hypothetical protein